MVATFQISYNQSMCYSARVQCIWWCFHLQKPGNNNRLSTGGFGYHNGNSTVGDEQADQHRSTPGHVWCVKHDVISGSGDQTTINTVVTGNVFFKVNIVDRDTELSYSTVKRSIYQVVISHSPFLYCYFRLVANHLHNQHLHH